jgi:hypothetical protein
MRYFLILFAACVPTSGGTEPTDETAADIAAYNELAADLDDHRTRFLGDEADELQAAANRIYWLQYAAFDPTVHSSRAGMRLNYGFPAGTAGNVRTSDALVVTATRDGDHVIYRAYDSNSANTPRGEASFAAPTDEQRWWAYAVDGGTVYVVMNTTVYRWAPGAAPTALLELPEVGIFLDFMVRRGQMLYIESGRLWSLDLATGNGMWVGNQKQISGAVSTDGTGILYVAADGPHYFAGGVTRDIKAELEDSDYAFNKTFASMHHFSRDAVLYAGRVIYKGQSGVFSYDLRTRAVKPLLLEPREGTRVDYIDPQITDETGTLYITGLESESGAVGADGPVYTIRL